MSWTLVFLQLSLIAAILLTGPIWARHPAALAAEALAALLGLWAVASMRHSMIRVQPEVAKGAHLVERGPYRWVRHPMYSAVLLLTAALVADAWSPARIGLWLALLSVLVFKLRREERFLVARFPEYAGYAQRTRRLLPGVW